MELGIASADKRLLIFSDQVRVLLVKLYFGFLTPNLSP